MQPENVVPEQEDKGGLPVGLIKIRHKGNFNKIEQFFNRALRKDYLNILAKYGEMGVKILKENTPVNSGKTAESWNYGIEEGKGTVTLYWSNSNENNGVNIAILLIYGHALQNGAYIEGIDFANQALKPVFDQIANETWKEVTE